MFNYAARPVFTGSSYPTWGAPTWGPSVQRMPMSGPSSPDTVSLSPAASASNQGFLALGQGIPAGPTLPNTIPGAYSAASTPSPAPYPGGLGSASLAASQSLLNSVQGDLNWTNAYTQGLASSGAKFGGASGSGGQTRSSEGSSPLTVQATALTNGNKQIPVSYIDIQEVSNPQNANGQYFGTGWYSQRETLSTAQAQKSYYVTVTWQNGQSYRSTVTDSKGGRTINISQPN